MSDRIGKFYLKQRGKRGLYQICWTDERRIPRSLSTGTADPEKAREALEAHALVHSVSTEQWRQVRDPKLAFVLTHYRSQKSDRMASIGTFDVAVLEICGDISVSQFNVPMQVRFIEGLRKRGNCDATIQRKLSALRPAFTRARKDELLTEIPPSAGADDWKPQFRQRPTLLPAKPEPRRETNHAALDRVTAVRHMREAVEQLLIKVSTATAAIARWLLGARKPVHTTTGG